MEDPSVPDYAVSRTGPHPWRPTPDDDPLPEPHDGMTPEEKGELLLRYVKAGRPMLRASQPPAQGGVGPEAWHGGGPYSGQRPSTLRDFSRANLSNQVLKGHTSPRP